MIIQLEVTTRCNYSCWYCTGRQMEQKDMTWETFLTCLDNSPFRHANLHGEGEPTLWPHFYEAAELLKRRGYTTETTTNGTTMDVPQMLLLFDTIHFTVDSVDEEQSRALGRPNVKKVLTNIKALAEKKSKHIIINTINYGQDLTGTVAFCRDNNLKHRIVALQKKEEYVAVYPQGTTTRALNVHARRGMWCPNLNARNYDYFNVDGLHRPCHFIKHPDIVNWMELKEQLHSGFVPASCAGCSMLR